MKGSFYDAIERLEFSFKWEKEIPFKTKTVEYYFYEVTIDQLQTILNDDSFVSRELITQEIHCSDCGGHDSSFLKVVYNLSCEEKREAIDHCLGYRKASIQLINKYLERNPEQKAGYIQILERRNLLNKI